MQKGFNSDITVRGKQYHIQTEDWGSANPYLVSRVFVNGAVVKTVKVSYAEAFKSGPVQDSQAIQLALKKQHNDVISSLGFL